MRPFLNYLLLFVLSLLYFLVVVPAGMCTRIVSDKLRLRLRRDDRAATYFRVLQASHPNYGCEGRRGVEQFTTRNS